MSLSVAKMGRERTTKKPVRASRRELSRSRRVIVSVAAVLLAGVAWWLISAYVVRSSVILPTPGETLTTFVDLAGKAGPSGLWTNVLASVLRVLVGWSLGLVVGVALGILMAASGLVRAALDPLLEGGRAIPPLAFAPLLLVWFGIGETSKVLLLFFAALPIFAVSTTAAVLSIDESLRRVSQTLGASRNYFVRRVVIPAVLPEIFVAMRVASAIVWTTLVAAELVAASEGLGFMILKAGRYLDTSTIFVGIICIGVFAYLFDRTLRLLQGRFVFWKGQN